MGRMPAQGSNNSRPFDPFRGRFLIALNPGLKSGAKEVASLRGLFWMITVGESGEVDLEVGC